MKAYAVHLSDEYWLVYAARGRDARAAVIRAEYYRDGRWLRHAFRTLRCRRWPALDDSPDWDRGPRAEYWGSPGARDRETGVRIEVPSPFAEEAPS